MAGEAKKKIKVALVAAGKYHDIDFARLEILKLLAEDERVRVRVFEDYSNISAICESDFLVTYTCDVMPRLDEQEALRAYVEGGGRWYALHGTTPSCGSSPMARWIRRVGRRILWRRWAQCSSPIRRLRPTPSRLPIPVILSSKA